MIDHPHKSWWQRSWFLGLLLVAVTFLAYQPAWRGEPVFDDEDHLTPPELQSVSGLARIWTEVGLVSQYYPITHSAFWLQQHLWGESMLGYHLLNILLHAFCALLLVRILHRLGVPGAWLAAGLFALHPVHVESVAWISELKNTLSAVFYLGAALVYLKFDDTRRRSVYLTAFGLFAVGLLAKTVIASLPAALLLVFWWKRGRLSWKQDVQPLLPFFVLGAGAGLFTAYVERTYIGAEGAAFELSWVERVLLAGRAIWFYLGKLAWPADLIFIYPRWQISQAAAWQYLFPVAAIAAVVALWMVRGRWRGPLVGLLFFAGTLFPVLGFLNVYPFIYSFVADHYQYLASLGFLVVASAGLARLLIRFGWWERPAGIAVCLLLLLTLAGLTWRQSRMYTGVETLWQTTLARNPTSFVAYTNLGNFYLERGQVDEAVRHAQKAAELHPSFAEIHNNLANALRAKGQIDEAVVHYRRALEIRPSLAVAHYNLGAIAYLKGELDEALNQFEKAVELRPEYVKARNNLGSVLLEKGRVDEALVHLQRALEVRPDDVEVLSNFGNALLRKGQTEEAIAQYQKALALQPDEPNTLHNLASVLLEKGQLDEAVPLLEKALASQPNFAQAHGSLGNARFRQGQVDEAIAHFEKALALRPEEATTHNDLGNALLQKGRFDEATAQYQKALEIRPTYDLAHFNFGYALLENGRIDEAIAHLQQAVTLQPEFAQSRYQLGNALLQRGDLDEAVVHLQKTVALQPDFPDALNNLGVALIQKGNVDEAVAQFQRALVVQPDFAEAHNNLGRTFLQQSQVEDAVKHYRASLKIEPNNSDTLSNLAWVFATGPDASVRNGLQAIMLAQRANQNTGGEDPFALRALAAAYAETGRFAEAVSTAERAVQLADSQGNTALSDELLTHLERYKTGSAFHEAPRPATPPSPPSP